MHVSGHFEGVHALRPAQGAFGTADPWNDNKAASPAGVDEYYHGYSNPFGNVASSTYAPNGSLDLDVTANMGIPNTTGNHAATNAPDRVTFNGYDSPGPATTVSGYQGIKGAQIMPPVTRVANDVDHDVRHRPACTICGQKIGRQADLGRHMKVHQPSAQKRCQVGDCGYVSYRKDKMVEHVRRIHPAVGVA